jgi:hypothetical protein
MGTEKWEIAGATIHHSIATRTFGHPFLIGFPLKRAQTTGTGSCELKDSRAKAPATAVKAR